MKQKKKFINLDKLIKIIYSKGVKLEIEKRHKDYHYGFPNNHAEILNFYNKADNDCWDALIFGYDNLDYPFKTQLFTKHLIGIILINNGNHKLLFKIPYKRGFSETKLRKDVNNYIKKYKKINKLKLKYIKF